MNRSRIFLAGALWIGALTASLSAALPFAVQTASGKNGMVVAGHPEAAAAGIRVLQAGGNAIDAAVATSLAATVAEPYGSSLGGKHVMVYFDAKTKMISVVQGMDAISDSMDVAKFIERRKMEKTSGKTRDIYGSGAYGYDVVGIPGLPAALWTAHEKWGKLPWEQVVQPAIEIARNGFTVLPKTRHFFEDAEKLLRRGDPEIARIYLPGGQLPVIGSRLKCEDLAHSLEIFARLGYEGFYRGPIASMIVSAAQKNGGTLTLQDYMNYQAIVEAPLAVDFRGYTLYSPGLPTTGSSYMFPTLAVLDGLKFEPGALRSAANLLLLQKIWTAVVPEAFKGNGRNLLKPESISAIREKILRGDGKVTLETSGFGKFAFDDSYAAFASTCSLATMDAEGNMCSMTQSDSSHFGAGVVPPGTGIIMSNANGNFNFEDPANWNYVAPGKRSSSTIVPTIAVKNGLAVFSIGLPGGGRIPSGVMQAIIDHIDFDRPFNEAIGDTRFNLRLPGLDGQGGLGVTGIEFESSVDPKLVEELKTRGLKITIVEEPFGGINVIERKSDGTMIGNADPRRANAASGY